MWHYKRLLWLVWSGLAFSQPHSVFLAGETTLLYQFSPGIRFMETFLVAMAFILHLQPCLQKEVQ